MNQILALSLVSALFASAGCAVGAGPSPSESANGLASTPGALEVAEKLTHDLRLQSPGAESTAGLPDQSASTQPNHPDVTVHVMCDPGCVAGCGEIGDAACAHSCCLVIVTTR